jgi:cytochrome c5
MKKYLLALTALSVILVGCGKDEEPMEKQKEEGSTAMEQQAKPMEQAAESTTMDSGGEMAEPPAEQTTAEEAMSDSQSMATEEAMPAEEPAAEADTAAMEETTMADSGQGKKTYDSVCFACHAQGIAGAPKLGDKAAWEPRIAQGMDTLVNHAINGFQGSAGVMPPKGGNMALSDEEVSAAVSYMVEQSQ